MRAILTGLILLTACAGPSRQQLADTPTGRTKMNTGEAPAASTSDRDREHEVNAFDDMQATQKAHAEAKQKGAQPPPAPPRPPPGPPGKTVPKDEPAQPKN